MDYKVFEARVLELFFKTGDRITAQLAAYRIGIPVDEARALLESMATREIVSMESDDNGVLYFDLPSRPPPTGEPLSWHVPQMAPMMPVAMAPMMPVAMVPVSPVQEKSMAAAILLPLFFGPLGMFYSTVMGALVMLVAGGLFDILTLGFGLLLTWPGCILWSALATNAHNNRVLHLRNDLQAQQHHYFQQQHAQYMASQRALPASNRPPSR
ncbi:MAG TPA: hypothetical protein VF469_36820 [Kofleriaceae bacterium]